MSMKYAFSALLSALLLLSGCVFPQKLSDRNRSALSAYAIALESGEGDTWLRYEGEISGEALDGLWEIIQTAENGEPISGGNWMTAFPCLVVTGKNGENYTVSCTWDKTEYTTGDFGEPQEEHTGRCMLIRGTRQGKYLIDNEAEKEFDRLISETLHDCAVPTVFDYYPNKAARSGNIVFAEVYSNWAWGFQCSASVVDDLGNVYSLDLGGHSEDIKNGCLMDALLEEYNSQNPFRYAAFSAEEMERVRTETAFDIDRTASVTEKHMCYDSGAKTLYVADSNGEMIMLRSRGDYDKTLEDKTAKQLAWLFDKGFYVN